LPIAEVLKEAERLAGLSSSGFRERVELSRRRAALEVLEARPERTQLAGGPDSRK